MNIGSHTPSEEPNSTTRTGFFLAEEYQVYLAGGSLRIGTEKFFRAAFLSNLLVWRKDRKLLRKAAQIIFLSSRKSERPRHAACRKKALRPQSQSPTDLFRSDLPSLPLWEKLPIKAARQVLRNSDFRSRCLFSMAPLPGTVIAFAWDFN